MRECKLCQKSILSGHYCGGCAYKKGEAPFGVVCSASHPFRYLLELWQEAAQRGDRVSFVRVLRERNVVAVQVLCNNCMPARPVQKGFETALTAFHGLVFFNTTETSTSPPPSLSSVAAK